MRIGDESALEGPRSAAGKEPDAQKILTIFVLVVATLYVGADVLRPIVLALLLAFILSPLIAILRNFHLGRVPSVLLGLLLALAVILGIGGIIGTQLSQLTIDLPRYAVTVEDKVDIVRNYTTGRLSEWAERIGSQRHTATSSPAPATLPALPEKQAAASQSVPAALDLVQRFVSPLWSPLSTLVIVFIVAVFALLQQSDLHDRVIRLLDASGSVGTAIGLDDAAARLSRFFMLQLGVNTAFGFVIGVGLLVIGVPNPILFGIIATLLRFVPYVGSLVAAALPMALAAAAEPGWSMAAWSALLFLVVESLTGQILEPLLYGHSTGLSPFAVVIAALFWGWLWGPIGLLLSTPLTLSIVAMGRHVPSLEFLDIMLGDNAALSPATGVLGSSSCPDR